MANGYSTMGVPGAVGMTRPSMGMTGGTMPNPSTMGMTGGTMPRPLAPFLSNLPLSNSPTIAVNESTPNLDRIQNFPVVSRNGVFHIHQDPATGQRYSMTDEFHARIPSIVSNMRINTVIQTEPNPFSEKFQEDSSLSTFSSILSLYNPQQRSEFSKTVDSSKQTKLIIPNPDTQDTNTRSVSVSNISLIDNIDLQNVISPFEQNTIINRVNSVVTNETDTQNFSPVVTPDGRMDGFNTPQTFFAIQKSPTSTVSIIPINSVYFKTTSIGSSTQPSQNMTVNYQINTYR